MFDGTVKPKDLFIEMVLCFCMFFRAKKKFFRSIFGEPSPGAQRRRWLYKNTYNNSVIPDTHLTIEVPLFNELVEQGDGIDYGATYGYECV